MKQITTFEIKVHGVQDLSKFKSYASGGFANVLTGLGNTELEALLDVLKQISICDYYLDDATFYAAHRAISFASADVTDLENQYHFISVRLS